jgi:transposase-like protein
MSLKQDERALLQLVCERGQSYEDLAGLLGISEDEVRAKARQALTELGGADPDAEVGLTDYLLGQADPIGRADAVRYLQQDPEARELATTIATKLQAIAPGATLPSIPEPRGRKRKSAAAAASAPTADATTVSPTSARGASGDEPGGSPRQTRMIAAIAGGGVILLFVILAIAGVFGGGDDSDSSSDSTTQAKQDAASLTPDAVAGLSDEQKAQLTGLSTDQVAGLSDDEIVAAAQQRTITPVKLDPVDGSGVAGGANFGLANDQLFIDLTLDGLDPKLSKGDVYVIWLMLNDDLGYPVSRLAPDENGSVNSRLAVPTPVAAAVGANAKSVLVTQTSSTDLAAAIKEAVKASQPVVTVSGKRLAEGNIPLAEGAGTGDTTSTAPSTTTPAG